MENLRKLTDQQLSLLLEHVQYEIRYRKDQKELEEEKKRQQQAVDDYNKKRQEDADNTNTLNNFISDNIFNSSPITFDTGSSDSGFAGFDGGSGGGAGADGTW